MKKSLLGSLKENELALVRETEPGRMAELDEDELLKLHSRIRRARNKYVQVYRRQASAGVEQHGGRGKSAEKNKRARDRAEVFEAALARVSKRVAQVAKQTASELKQARLAAVRATRASGPASDPAEPPAAGGEGLPQGVTTTTGGLKRDASSRAEGARRQAARDAR